MISAYLKTLSRRASALACLSLILLPIQVQAGDKGPGRSVPTLGNAHVKEIREPHIPYNTVPPTSGPHLSFVAKWGINKIPIPNELQVHNLEDGGVLIQYNPDPLLCKDCPALIAKLENLVELYQLKNPREKYHRLIVAPYPGMKTLIALTAWGRIDTLSGYDEKRIVRFIEAYIGIDHHPKEDLQK